MLKNLAIILAGVSTLCSASAATTLSGAYDFRTFAQKNGAPVCVERWDFGADGNLVVHSGQEIVTQRFRLEHDAVGDWIVMSGGESNGLPDCMGQSNPSRPKESRLYWFASNDGTISVCPPPATSPVVVIGGCFAVLRRATD